MLKSRKRWSRDGLKRLLLVGSWSVFLTSTYWHRLNKLWGLLNLCYWSLKSTFCSGKRRSEADLSKDALNVCTLALFLVNIKMCKEKCLRSLHLTAKITNSTELYQNYQHLSVFPFKLFVMRGDPPSNASLLKTPVSGCTIPSSSLRALNSWSLANFMKFVVWLLATQKMT